MKIPKFEDIIAILGGILIYEVGVHFNLNSYLSWILAIAFISLIYFFSSIKKRLDRNKSKTLQKDLQKYGLYISRDEITKIAKEITGKKQILNSDYKFIGVSEIMIYKKFGFEIDWKWIPSDILFEIKKIIPKFSYKIEKESDDPYDKKIIFKGTIMGDGMEFFTPNDKPNEFIKKIEPKIIELTNKKFNELETEGDYYCFILIPK